MKRERDDRYIQVRIVAMRARTAKLTLGQKGLYRELVEDADGAGIVGPVTATALAEHHGVSRNKLRRDLEAMTKLRVLDHYLPGAGHDGWVQVLRYESVIEWSVHAWKRRLGALAKWESQGQRAKLTRWPLLQRAEMTRWSRAFSKRNLQSHSHPDPPTNVIPFDQRRAELRNGDEIEERDVVTGQLISRRPT